jgi:hypothetical protein
MERDEQHRNRGIPVVQWVLSGRWKIPRHARVRKSPYRRHEPFRFQHWPDHRPVGGS